MKLVAAIFFGVIINSLACDKDLVVQLDPPMYDCGYVELFSSNAVSIVAAGATRDGEGGVRYVFQDMHEGAYRVGIMTGVGRERTYVESYAINFTYGQEVILQLPKDRVLLNIYLDTQVGTSGVYLKLQKFNCNGLDPIYNRLLKLTPAEKSRSKGHYYCAVTDVELQKDYLLTFIAPVEGGETVEVGSARVSFDEEDIDVSILVSSGIDS